MPKLAKTFRLYVRLFHEVSKKHGIVIFVSSLFGIGVFFAWLKLSPLIPKPTPIKTIGIIGQFSPTNLPPEITTLISQGLTHAAPNGSALPAVAKSWEILDNSKVFRFQINPDAKWQDNTPVKAQDINYSFKDVDVNIVSDSIIEFKLKDSYTPFPLTVSRPLFKKNYIGVGDYKLSGTTSIGQTITSAILKPMHPGLPKLIFRFYPTEDTAITAFKLGEISQLRDITSPRELFSWPRVNISGQAKQDRYIALFFNTQKDLFKSKNLRQALAYAIDKTRFPDRSISPISALSASYNSTVKPYDKDLTRVKALLKGENITDLKIEISTFSWLLKDAETIKQEWQAIGINTSVKVVNGVPDDFDTLLAAQAIPADPDQYSLWHSTQPTNITRLKNPKIDKLLEDGRKTADPLAREKIYLDFQRFLVEETPAVFLYHPISYTVSRW